MYLCIVDTHSPTHTCQCMIIHTHPINVHGIPHTYSPHTPHHTHHTTHILTHYTHHTTHILTHYTHHTTHAPHTYSPHIPHITHILTTHTTHHTTHIPHTHTHTLLSQSCNCGATPPGCFPQGLLPSNDNEFNLCPPRVVDLVCWQQWGISLLLLHHHCDSLRTTPGLNPEY